VDDGRKPVPAGLGQAAYRVHRARSQTCQGIAGSDRRQRLLLRDRTMCDRPQDLRIQACIAGDLLGVHRVALPVAVRDRPQLAHVGHNHLMTQLPDLLADPDRVGARFHGNPGSIQAPEALVHPGRVGSEPAPVYYLAVLVESAVMAPDVPEVDPDRHPDLGTSAWFRYEVLRMSFHAHSLSHLRKTFSSHFAVTCPDLRVAQLMQNRRCAH
jgi:hypothetical protein